MHYPILCGSALHHPCNNCVDGLSSLQVVEDYVTAPASDKNKLFCAQVMNKQAPVATSFSLHSSRRSQLSHGSWLQSSTVANNIPMHMHEITFFSFFACLCFCRCVKYLK